MVVMAQAADPLEATSMIVESADDSEMQDAVAATLAAAGEFLLSLCRPMSPGTSPQR
jgi:hypothetical protein